VEVGEHWVDLLDPDEAELRRHVPQLHPRAIEQLLRPAASARQVRPSIEGHGDYVFGLLLPAVAVPEEDRIYYQEVDFVLTPARLVTVRKTPPGEQPFDPQPAIDASQVREDLSPGLVAYHLVDEVAESYLDLLDALAEEVDELEEGVQTWKPPQIQRRISELRHELISIRRVVAPTRDAVRGIVDGRTDLEGRALFRREVFPQEVELHFGAVYDKLLRASEALELGRDLLAAVREYHQTRLASDQNEVVKKLAVVASLLLFPTFIVGVYGQNFEHMPELGWRLGYAFSWGIIALITVLQLLFFRWRRWI
jgi:magnesium transporter